MNLNSRKKELCAAGFLRIRDEENINMKGVLTNGFGISRACLMNQKLITLAFIVT